MFDDKEVTADDQKSTDGPKPNRLAERAPKRALPFAARTSAIMRVATGQRPERVFEEIVKLSEALVGEPVALALINGLQVKPDKPTTSYTRWRAVRPFLSWTEDRMVEGEFPKDIFDQYRQSLNAKAHTGKSVAGIISSISTPIRAAAANPDFMNTLDNDEQTHLRSVIALIPSIPSAPGKKKPGMGDLFEDLPDDRALLEGLNDFTTWALTELQLHREELLRDHDVREALEHALEIVGDDIDGLAWRSINTVSRTEWNPNTLCNSIYEAVCLSESATLKERLLLGDSESRKHLFDCETSAALSVDELNARLTRCRRAYADGDGRANHRILLKTHNNFGFLQCDLLSLVKPTDAENICVQWLLAGVAVQTSGQARAKVGDYIIQPSTTYLDYKKERSTTKRKHTDYIRPRSAKGKALIHFIELKERHGQGQMQLLERNYLINPTTSTSPRWRFLMAATRPASAIRQAFLDQHPSGEGVLELLTRLRIHGDAYSKFNASKEALRRKLKKGQLIEAECEDALQTLRRTSPVTSKITLAPDHIRNTRIALLEASPSRTDVERAAKERALAASNGHTADVMKWVYKLHDTSRFGVKKRAEFAAAVGEIMTVLSQKIRDAYDATTVLTPENVANIVSLDIGFETDDECNDRLMAELEISGYRLNYFGAHSKGKQRIVVAEPVTVALMLSASETYVKRAQDERVSEDVRAEAVLEFALIEELLRQMPKDVVMRGRDLFERKAFPSITPTTDSLPVKD